MAMFLYQEVAGQDSLTSVYLVPADTAREDGPPEQDEDDLEEDEVDEGIVNFSSKHDILLDMGFTNYLFNGRFPDATDELFTLDPLGSSYIALNSTTNSHLFGPVFVDWGGGLSWYNFKFQDPKMRVTKAPDQVLFYSDSSGYNQYKRSKLKAMFLNAFVVPVIYAGNISRGRGFKNFHRGARQSHSFRIGVGGYAGYRLTSKAKLVYVDGKKQKMKERGNFYLNSFRYGIRGQVGWNSIDLFFNYDLNTLFQPGKGPELNTFSFGIIF